MEYLQDGVDEAEICVALVRVGVQPHLFPIVPEVEVHEGERRLHVDGGRDSVDVVVVDQTNIRMTVITSPDNATSSINTSDDVGVGIGGLGALRKAGWGVLWMGTRHFLVVESSFLHSNINVDI